MDEFDDFGNPLNRTADNVSTVSTPNLSYLVNTDNEPVGNTSNNYVAPGSYTGTGLTNTANFSDLTSLANSASKFLSDNKGLLTAGGADLVATTHPADPLAIKVASRCLALHAP